MPIPGAVTRRILEFKVGSGKVKGFKGYAYESCDDSSGIRQTAYAVEKAMKIREGRRYSSVVVGSVCDTYKLKWKAKRG